MIQTAGLFGSYGDTFGSVADRRGGAHGLFWDDGDDDVEDPLIAWILDDGRVEQRRDVDGGVVSNLAEMAFLLFDDLNDFASGLAFSQSVPGASRTLANLNLNFAIDVAAYAGDLHPAGHPVAGAAAGDRAAAVAGIGAFAMIRRRKRAKAA